MSTTFAPRGLVPARKVGGGANSTGTVTWDVLMTIGDKMPNNLYTGDPIFIDAGGTISNAITLVKPSGVFQGCSFVDASGQQQYKKMWTGGVCATDVKVHVQADPAQTFYIQSNTCVSNGVLGNRVMNVPATVSTSGDTVTGDSRYFMVATSITVSDNMLRIIGRAKFDTGVSTTTGVISDTDAFPWYEVRINSHRDNYVTTTVSTA
jgi:hypothetical protein